MTLVLVALCVLAGAAPWWSARTEAGRRAVAVGRAAPAPDDPAGNPSGRRRRGDDREPGIETGVLLQSLIHLSERTRLQRLGCAVGSLNI